MSEHRIAVDELLRVALRDPVDGSTASSLEAGLVRFAGGRTYSCSNGHPILLDEDSSLFSVADITADRATTQDRSYRTRRSLKNYVRMRMLPGLTRDRGYDARHFALAAETKGRPVLVLGAGDRIETYQRMFEGSVVVTSDVHLQFGADCVIDAHRIPFATGTFGLVLAAQVLEHTTRPWIVAAEMQRVAQPGGLVHVEVPFGFPYHGAPYDFYRFTPSALRFLFPESELVAIDVTEGRFSAAAVFVSSAVIDSFGGRYQRAAAMLGARLSMWWLKYLDARGPTTNRFASPKGVYLTVRCDGQTRDDRTMLAEVTSLLG